MNARTRARTRWSRRRWVLAIGAVLVAVAAVAWVVVVNSSGKPTGAATQVVRVTRGTQTTTVTLSGTLAPQQQANVSFATSGTVREIQARVGDAVAAGQALAAIDDRDLRNAVTLAEAQLTAARAQLQTVRDADSATSAQVAAARAQVASAQASADSARTRLSDAVLASPLAGVVAEVNLKVGDQVSGASASVSGLSGSGSNPLSGLTGLTSGSSSTGAQIVVVVPDAWQLNATIGTADLPSLKVGQAAVVTPTGTSTDVAAVVDTIGIVASGASGAAATFPTTLRITGVGAQLFSGANADAVVTTATLPGVLTIPTEAITSSGDKVTVQRPAASGTQSTEITIGRRFGDRIEVTGGLAEGDEILAPVGVVVSTPPRPQFGPNGQFASPDASASPSR